MTEIHLKAYAINKNVTAEIFLEIIDNWPFFKYSNKTMKKQVSASVWGNSAEVWQFCHDG